MRKFLTLISCAFPLGVLPVTACGDDDDKPDSQTPDDDVDDDDDDVTDDDVTDDDDADAGVVDDDTTGDDDVADDDVVDDDTTGDDDVADDDVDDDTTGDDDVADDDTADIMALVEDRPDYSTGESIFRHDSFGTEVHWTENLRMHEVIASAVDPVTALTVGLKVDADVLPAGILDEVDLEDPATTVALLQLDAVVGVKGHVNEDGELIAVGITCALCHSTVDDSVMPGIGSRVDGPANRDLDPGFILSLSPYFDEETAETLASWGPGRFDPRFNQDGINGPVLIPPVYGLEGVEAATYTGDGDISYWNNYVAVTQMGGLGDFSDERIGVDLDQEPELVEPQLDALREYQLSLEAPDPPPGSFDATAAARGETVFFGDAECGDCHTGDILSDAPDTLHDANEIGVDPEYAERSATGQYRTTPLRALFDRTAYFHDGSAETLEAVVEHYDTELELELSDEQKSDLVEFLKSL